MKKILFLLPFALLLCHSERVQACEIPVTGMNAELQATEENDLYIAYYSTIYDVDSYLVKAVIAGESKGDAKACNHNSNGSHDRGLMQINSCNFEWLREELDITDFYDARQSIQCGCFILGRLSDKYDNAHRILMCYNMGEHRTSELWLQGIYSSEYSRKVVNKLNQIRRDAS